MKRFTFSAILAQKKMRTAAIALGLASGALSLACSTMTTSIDYDHSIDWSRYRTFQLAEGTRAPASFTQKRIEDAITNGLKSKGWGVTTSNPDILVYPHVVLSQEKQWNATSTGGMGYRWGGMGGTATVRETNIPIGTLIVDLVDARTQELVWRGRAQDQVSGSGEDRGKVQDAVNALFKDFPPAPGK